MRCDRFINRSGDGGQVMGTFSIQRIALRGPGCISGTGRCEGVAGTGGRRRCCEEVAGTGGGCWRNDVAGTGGRCWRDEVAGTGGRRCRNFEGLAGTGDRRRCDWDYCDWCLKTPIVVPR